MADNNDDVTALENFIKSTVVDFVNTSIECEVVSYERGKVTVKPIGDKGYDDGDSNAYPILHNLRMQWPQFDGGKSGFKGKVSVGDKCLLIVVQHSTDDSGDNRKYSLVDSYVIPGAGYSDEVPGNDDIRMYNRDAFIAITDDGRILLNAPGGMEAETPLATFSQAVTVNGLFTYTAGASGGGGTGQTMTINGNVIISGEATINGVKVSTHIHPTPNGNSGQPIKG